MSIFETAEFGNHSGSHQLLKSSLPSTSPVLDELRFLVDRPAGHIGSEVAWSPYWGCGSVHGFWALWRGEEDLSAPRKNMVKAHVVLVPSEQCAAVENFDELLAAVGYSVPDEENAAVSALAGAVVDCLARREPAIIPNLSIAPLLIRAVWTRLWASARATLSLRTLFGVESLESSFRVHIIVIPEELRPRWKSFPLIDGKNIPTNALTRWFGGEDSPQLNSLVAKNVTKLSGDLGDLKRLERIAVCLERLHSGTGTIADALLVMRSLDSLDLPKKDIQAVGGMLDDFSCASVGEVRSASLAKLDIFEDHTLFKNALSQWIENRLPEQSIKDALWIIEQHAGTQHSDWWRTAVGKGIANGCKSMSQAWAQALWSWWSANPDSLQWMKVHLPVDVECEKWISGYAPTKVGDELLNTVIELCHGRKWVFLLARVLGTTRPLEHCIEVLRHIVPNPEAGLDILLSKRSAGEIVDVAAGISWEPLIARAVLHTVSSPQLLVRISDFRNLVPLLLRHLSAGGVLPAELQTNEFIVKVFDAIVEGKTNCIMLAKQFGRWAGRYLLEHQEKKRLWEVLLPVVSADFVAGAVDEWWVRFLSNEKAESPPRPLCGSVLKSAPGKLRGSSITLVIGLLNLIPDISEAQFQDWMLNQGFSWDIGDHNRLADLLLERKWKSTAKEFRWSWKRELQLVAWHARELLSWSDKFMSPPADVDQPIRDGVLGVATASKNPKKRMKILFLAANPMGTNRLALDEEARTIKDKLRMAKHRDSVELSTQWAVRPSDLQQTILEEEPTVVHFSGHGGGSIGIVMHSDSQDDESLVSSDVLADLFRVLKDDIRVVVLNACYSEVQATAIVEQIDFVVGMSDSIGDEAARVFAAAFYRGLAFGKAIQTAFDLGISDLRLAGLHEDQQVPMLMVRTGVDAKTTILVTDD